MAASVAASNIKTTRLSNFQNASRSYGSALRRMLAACRERGQQGREQSGTMRHTTRLCKRTPQRGGVLVFGTVNVHIKKTKSCCDAVTVGLFELEVFSFRGEQTLGNQICVSSPCSRSQRMEGDHCRKEEPKCGKESGVNPDHHTPKSKLLATKKRVFHKTKLGVLCQCCC